MDEDNFVVSFYASDNKGQWLKARFNEIGNLQQENKELKSRIDNAIDYIDVKRDDLIWTTDATYKEKILKGLLEILGMLGDSNE